MFQLPPRSGPPPQTSDCTPHQQLDQNPSLEIHARFKACAFDFPFVERRPSAISVPGAEAHWLVDEHAHGCRESFLIGNEFAHVHPAYDGSMHMMLPRECVAELLDKGWGEAHPLVSTGHIPDTAVMVFGPRNDGEITTALKILAASYDFATGKLANPGKVMV